MTGAREAGVQVKGSPVLVDPNSGFVCSARRTAKAQVPAGSRARGSGPAGSVQAASAVRVAPVGSGRVGSGRVDLGPVDLGRVDLGLVGSGRVDAVGAPADVGEVVAGDVGRGVTSAPPYSRCSPRNHGTGTRS